MDGYQFTAAIFQSVASLAWPVAFVVAVALFRGRLSQLLPFLRLKHKDVEVSFRLEQAEKQAQQIPAPANTIESDPTPEEKLRFEQVAEHSPRAAILEKRAELEQILSTFAEPFVQKTNSAPARRTNLTVAIRILRKAGILDEKTSALLDDLRAIGNQAAHDPEGAKLNKTAAVRFGQLVDTVIRYIGLLI